jgi:hypothetical protein
MYKFKYQLPVCLWLRRCKKTSVFAVTHILSHFFCISLMSLFTEFPAFTMFAISCHALFLSPEVIDEENFAFKITFSLLVHLQQYNFFYISVQFGFSLDIFLFSTVTNSNIQTHPTLNVYPHKVIKCALSIYWKVKAKLPRMSKYNIKR